MYVVVVWGVTDMEPLAGTLVPLRVTVDAFVVDQVRVLVWPA